LNWELAETLEFEVYEDDQIFHKRNGDLLSRSLFQKNYEKEFDTGLEREVAWYLDDNESVKWWHRMVARKDYYVQGWQRHKIYPDFLACLKESLDGKRRFTVLETKGMHLQGNPDTEYKARLFDLLMEFYSKSLEVGEVEIINGQNQEMVFKILLEDSWRNELSGLCKGAS